MSADGLLNLYNAVARLARKQYPFAARDLWR